MMIQSGTRQSNCCTISMPTVFCPSTRSEFMLLARYTPSSLAKRCTTFMQSSKLPSKASTVAPLASGCTSWAVEIFPRGRMTMARIPAAAA